MNDVYVDKLPKNCEKCPCYSYSEGFCNCECWYQKYGEIKDVAEYTHLGLKENERPTDCPLKSLTDRLAEEFEALKETFVWGRDNGYLTPKSAVGIVENKIKDLRGKNE